MKPRRTAILNAVIRYLAARTGYVWEPGTARYRNNSTGRFVAEKAIVAEIGRYADRVTENATSITQRFTDGNITSQQWRALMGREIKDAYIVQLQAGTGGRLATTQADYGRIGGRLAFQYRQLNKLQAEFEAGTISEKQLMARAQMYTQSSRQAFFDGATASNEAAGYTEERRTLGAVRTVLCATCVGYAARGWVPIGTLPEPGQDSECLSNCRCNKEYR